MTQTMLALALALATMAAVPASALSSSSLAHTHPLNTTASRVLAARVLAEPHSQVGSSLWVGDQQMVAIDRALMTRASVPGASNATVPARR
jgi:hypothetical protein